MPMNMPAQRRPEAATPSQQARAQSVATPQPAGASEVALVDQRPEAALQMRLASVAEASPRAAQLRALQARAGGSAQARDLAQLAAMTQRQTHAVQRANSQDEQSAQLVEMPVAPNVAGVTRQLKTGIEALSGKASVQRKIAWDQDGAITRNRYHPARNKEITSSVYTGQFTKVDELKERVTVIESSEKSQGEGDYEFKGEQIGAVIRVHPLEGDPNPDNQHFNDNIATLGHEFQHALDALGNDKINAFGLETGDPQRWNIIHTEWRAWAIQAAINYQGINSGAIKEKGINSHQDKMLATYLNPEHRLVEDNHFFRKTCVYINEHVLKDSGEGLDADKVKHWMLGKDGALWWEESLNMFRVNANLEQVADEAVEEPVPVAEVISISDLSDLDIKAPGMKSAGASVEKIRKDGSDRIFKFKGKLYRLPPSVLESGNFDSATGAWA